MTLCIRCIRIHPTGGMDRVWCNRATSDTTHIQLFNRRVKFDSQEINFVFRYYYLSIRCCRHSSSSRIAFASISIERSHNVVYVCDDDDFCMKSFTCHLFIPCIFSFYLSVSLALSFIHPLIHSPFTGDDVDEDDDDVTKYDISTYSQSNAFCCWIVQSLTLFRRKHWHTHTCSDSNGSIERTVSQKQKLPSTVGPMQIYCGAEYINVYACVVQTHAGVKIFQAFCGVCVCATSRVF